jgi:hypothetical protein
MARIEELKKWSEIDAKAKNNLLLGNGFSIAFASDFAYSSLRSKAIEYGYLSENDKELFTNFQTNDFELLLRRLRDAAKVNQLLGIDYHTPTRKYQSVQEALIKTIGHVHPDPNKVSSEQRNCLAVSMREFGQVFTTNYDLILYWIMGSTNFVGFTDYFWSGSLTFDPFDTDNWYSNRTEVFYLHGALFLFNKDGMTYKLNRQNQNNNLISRISEEIQGNRALPVFISEGSSEDKENALRRNSYLTFAFNQYRHISKGLTVYGSSLNPLSDGHILKAIVDNRNLDIVAVSIYTGNKSEEEIIDTMNDLENNLKLFKRRKGIVQFYDYSTSPFLP